MKQLLKYLKNYRKESIIGPLFKLTEACFELTIPLIMASIIDTGIAKKDMSYIMKLGGVMVLLGLLGLCCSMTAQYFAAKASMGFGTELRHEMFEYINSLSFGELDKAGTSTLITRMTVDINQVQSGVNLALRLFLRSPFIVLGAIIMSFTIDSGLAVIFIITTLIIAAVVCLIILKTIPMYSKVQQKLDNISLLSSQGLSGARVIRAFAKQKNEKEDYMEATEGLYRLSKYTGRISALLNPVTYLLLNIAVIVVIWCGGKATDSGDINQGQVIALIQYMSQILLALIAMANLINSFAKAIASADRVSEVFAIKGRTRHSDSMVNANEELYIKWCSEASGYKIMMRQASFAYNEAEEVLSNINIEIKKGETIGIIGGTGSGKTSLVNLLPRFYELTSGIIFVDGKNTKEYSLDNLRKKFGVVPQKAMLFRGTIRDNICFGSEGINDEDIYSALEAAQAREFVEKLPDGLDTVLTQDSRNLSGGQKQRLTICRALIGNPDILILDDSSSALDYATDAALRKSLKKTTGDMTVIIVSQRANAIMHADKILVLDDGRQVGFEKHEKLLENCGVYREIYLSQQN